jgi:hypothetical protein
MHKGQRNALRAVSRRIILRDNALVNDFRAMQGTVGLSAVSWPFSLPATTTEHLHMTTLAIRASAQSAW